MKPFLDENFLLQNEIAEQLYHQYAKDLPIIDYHNHLPPDQVSGNHQFGNISEAWLHGDHYKWRAMRANGVNESYITGSASDAEKFQKWAETVPYTMRNPLYHWTHLELQRYFDIPDLLNGKNAQEIYSETSQKLQSPDFRVHGLLSKMNLEVICTTDDPTDNLAFHQAYRQQAGSFKMFPAFRPDKAMSPEQPDTFNAYVDRLGAVCNVDIHNFQEYLDALKSRHDFFAEQGCCLSDHGLSHFYAADYQEADIAKIFQKIRSGASLLHEEIDQFKSAMLVYFSTWDHEKGWVQQFHVGAFRNSNPQAMAQLGPDSGYDSIGDFSQGQSMLKFFGRMADRQALGKTILYNLNPMDNELFASMCGNFNDGQIIGKMQFGSGWWYNDQKDGMTRQINALSNIGLLSRFVGMLTDSRSFLSFPRHEYFRRLLCNIFAEDIRQGELPHDLEWIGKIIQDICYYNAKSYFPFK